MSTAIDSYQFWSSVICFLIYKDFVIRHCLSVLMKRQTHIYFYMQLMQLEMATRTLRCDLLILMWLCWRVAFAMTLMPICTLKPVKKLEHDSSALIN